jgi:hypothetical protein
VTIPMVDPALMLGSALNALPGGYALLLGAGISATSGIPTAWGVVEQLIEEIADRDGGLGGAAPDDWWQQQHEGPPSYGGVLAAVARTPSERSAKLRPFFEPTDEERETGAKLPTAAHRAIAGLMAASAIRVVITLNFDRLLEQALQEVGVNPVVVTSDGAARGMAPLHLQSALIIHLNGDYLDPTTRNTADELTESYGEQLDLLLARIFDEYGLVVAGWSAEWDLHLRHTLERASNRRYTTWWVNRSALDERARSLANLRDAVVVEQTTDEFFPAALDCFEAIRSSHRRDALTVGVAVATAKRELEGSRVGISLHDRLKRESDAIKRLPSIAEVPFSGGDADDYRSHVATLLGASEVLTALVAASTYWGSDQADEWSLEEIDELVQAGLTPLPYVHSSYGNPRLVPACLAYHAAGVAAVGARRDGLAVRLARRRFRSPDTRDERAMIDVLRPQAIVHGSAWLPPSPSSWLFLALRPVFEVELRRSTSFASDWDRWVLFQWITSRTHAVDWPLDVRGWYVRGMRRTDPDDQRHWPVAALRLFDELRDPAHGGRHPLDSLAGHAHDFSLQPILAQIANDWNAWCSGRPLPSGPSYFEDCYPSVTV